MRIFVTGASGLLGLNAMLQLKDRHEVSGSYLTHPIRVMGAMAHQGDLSNVAVVEEIFGAKRPEVVLHTAGLTNVDACQANPAEATRLHVQVTRHVARAAQRVGAKLVHISTCSASHLVLAYSFTGAGTLSSVTNLLVPSLK